MAHGKYWTEADTQKLEELKRQNLSVMEIARQMGRSKTAVYERFTPPESRKHYRNAPQRPVTPSAPEAEPARPYDPLRDSPRMKRILGANR